MTQTLHVTLCAFPHLGVGCGILLHVYHNGFVCHCKNLCMTSGNLDILWHPIMHEVFCLRINHMSNTFRKNDVVIDMEITCNLRRGNGGCICRFTTPFFSECRIRHLEINCAVKQSLPNFKYVIDTVYLKKVSYALYRRCTRTLDCMTLICDAGEYGDVIMTNVHMLNVMPYVPHGCTKQISINRFRYYKSLVLLCMLTLRQMSWSSERLLPELKEMYDKIYVFEKR